MNAHVWPCAEKRCPLGMRSKKAIEAHEREAHRIEDSQTFWRRQHPR